MSMASLGLTAAGVCIGFLVGAIIARTNFCALGAISDYLLFSQTDRLRFWAIAAMTAMFGTGFLAVRGVIDLSVSSYWRIPISVSGAVVGGTCFGVGMVLASGCIVKNITRIGSGSIKSFVVVVFAAISAQATMTGVFSPLKNWIQNGVTASVSPSLLNGGFFYHAVLLGTLVCGIIVAMLWKRNRSVGFWLAAVFLGFGIVGGWWVTTLLSANAQTMDMVDFWSLPAGPESVSYVRPLGKALEWFSLGHVAGNEFGFGVLAGTLGGAALYYGLAGHWQWRGFSDVKDLGSHLCGAVLMGFGGVVGGGCTMGQGLTGLSAFSIAAGLTVSAIIISAAITLYALQRLIFDK